MPSSAPAPFANETYLDFADGATAQAMQRAIAAVEQQLGREYESGGTGAWFTSTDPAQPSRLIGTHRTATADDVAAAAAKASSAGVAWANTPASERAGILLRIASTLRDRKLELNAWLNFEVGKNYGEADAEVAEAIDFLELYARLALHQAERKPITQLPNEVDTLMTLPLGVVAVLPPWNFPLAIMAGMAMAAVVTGNTALLKPSPDAPTIAAVFVAIAKECGLPDGVLNLLQGGAETGHAIVSHPAVQIIAFTGSKKVGVALHEQAAKMPAGKRNFTRTVLELGGKDAIIVLNDADLDSAAEGVVASAFGFSGQKCSACSRLIVESSVHDALLQKVVDRASKLVWATPQQNGQVAPLINRAAYDRLINAIATAKGEGSLVLGGDPLSAPEDGYFIAPTIVDGIAPGSRTAQEEIFGPLLAVITAQDFDDALHIANDTEYGLTGAIYTSSQASIDRARREFHVGNLYINRKCTGAMVGATPFGGFQLSGTNSKAGGLEYLDHFVQIKSVAQRVTRTEASLPTQTEGEGL